MSLVELEFYLTTDFFFSPKNSIAVYAIRFCRIETKRDSDPYHSCLKKNTCSVARVIGIPPLGGARVMKTPEKRISFLPGSLFLIFFSPRKVLDRLRLRAKVDTIVELEFFLTTDFFFSPKKTRKKNFAGSK